MRTVKFDGSQQSKDRFSIFWQGFNVGDQGLKGIEQLELGSRVVRKLKAVSRDVPVPEGSAADRELNGACEIRFEEDEYGRLVKSLIEVPWRPLAAEKAHDAIQFLNDIEQDKDDLGVAPEARTD